MRTGHVRYQEYLRKVDDSQHSKSGERLCVWGGVAPPPPSPHQTHTHTNTTTRIHAQPKHRG